MLNSLRRPPGAGNRNALRDRTARNRVERNGFVRCTGAANRCPGFWIAGCGDDGSSIIGGVPLTEGLGSGQSGSDEPSPPLIAPEDYITDRLEQYQGWYDKKAVTMKARHLQIRVLAVGRKNYRSTEQLLGHEKVYFRTRTGPYEHLGDTKAFRTLVERVEGAIAAENSATLNVMTTAQQVSEPAYPRGVASS